MLSLRFIKVHRMIITPCKFRHQVCVVVNRIPENRQTRADIVNVMSVGTARSGQIQFTHPVFCLPVFLGRIPAVKLLDDTDAFESAWRAYWQALPENPSSNDGWKK